jgi:demethylmenaquinone methyltransferase/2-methoxy-6-polyprenyl-1,4-benzoquinol methylase
VAAKNELARRIFGGLSPSYDSVLDRMTLLQDGNWKRRMLERLPLGQGARVLDVGCGTCVLEERSDLKGSQAFGIDITGGMIALAQKKGLRSVTLLGLADAEHLPFKEATFDLVVSCYVPKYCDTRRLVKELGRVLRQGGQLAVYDFTRPHGLLSPFLSFYIWGLLPVFARLIAPLDPSLAFMCGVLPGLVRSTNWDDEFGRALHENDFSKVCQESLTGGVATVIWASKN